VLKTGPAFETTTGAVAGGAFAPINPKIGFEYSLKEI
jgi:hypothetical protein